MAVEWGPILGWTVYKRLEALLLVAVSRCRGGPVALGLFGGP